MKKTMLDKLDLVMVSGKKPRKVPILLPEDTQEPMMMLLEYRVTSKIP